MEQILKTVEGYVHSDIATRILTAVGVLLITYLVSVVAVRLMRKVIRSEETKLPDSTIFLNLVRVLVWIVGVGIVLNFCFDIDVSALIAALGIGGIAVSLGFQDTIANLIGGLLVSFSRIIKPGDNIKVVTDEEIIIGVVDDMTWRHTRLFTENGERVIIPNSSINTDPIAKLPPPNEIHIPIVVTVGNERLTVVAHSIENAAQKAVQRITALKRHPSVAFFEVTAQGFRGTLTIIVEDSSRICAVKDAALRAIAPFVHSLPAPDVLEAEAVKNQESSNAPAPIVEQVAPPPLAIPIERESFSREDKSGSQSEDKVGDKAS